MLPPHADGLPAWAAAPCAAPRAAPAAPAGLLPAPPRRLATRRPPPAPVAASGGPPPVAAPLRMGEGGGAGLAPTMVWRQGRGRAWHGQLGGGRSRIMRRSSMNVCACCGSCLALPGLGAWLQAAGQRCVKPPLVPSLLHLQVGLDALAQQASPIDVVRLAINNQACTPRCLQLRSCVGAWDERAVLVPNILKCGDAWAAMRDQHAPAPPCRPACPGAPQCACACDQAAHPPLTRAACWTDPPAPESLSCRDCSALLCYCPMTNMHLYC